jgi:hypothetical protein
MLLSIPDAIVAAADEFEPEGDVDEGVSCETEPQIQTSCDNRYYDNHMGVVPPGFKTPEAVHDFGNNVGSASGVLPNGVDFWWDEFLSNTGNCWYGNIGPDGSEASITGSGPGTPPDLLPSDCGTSVGVGDVAKELNLVNCFFARSGDADPAFCDWFTLPPEPATNRAERHAQRERADARAATASADGRRIASWFDELGATLGVNATGRVDRGR